MKNRLAIRLLLLANFISGIAQGISMISIPAYFASSQQSNWFSIAYIFITCGSLFSSLYGGTLIDKYNRKHIFLWLNLINGLAIGGIAFWASNDGAPLPYLAASVFALTFWNYSLHYPCFYAFMQEITEKEYYNKIASYIEVQSQLASALAGAFAAILLGGGLQTPILSFTLEPWSLSEIFFLDAGTYFVALGIIFLMRFEPIASRTAELGSVVERLRVGYQYLQERPYIFLFGVATHAVFVVVLLHVFNLAPIYVEQHLQLPSQVFAISEIFYASGAIIAGLAIHKLFKGVPLLKAIIILMLVSILEFVGLISSNSALIFYVVSLLLGITNAGIRVLRVSYLFQILPNQIMGRANSIFFLANIIARIGFLSLFGLSFFHRDGQVIYAFGILSIFMAICMGILIYFYDKMILDQNK